MKDLIIIGGGPAGIAAGVYAARKQLQTTLITKEWGGQSSVSVGIQNWIGTKEVSGEDFAKMLKEHLETYKGECVTIVPDQCVASLKRKDDVFIVTTEDGSELEAKSVFIGAGAHRRKLIVSGAEAFENKGVVYCASCDGPLFSGMDTVVVGGGNAGFETAAQLLAYAKSVTLLHRSREFKADPITVEKVLSHENMTALKNTEPTEILGENFVQTVKYKNSETGEEGELSATGVFVEIGLVPNTDFAKDILELDDIGRIKVNPKNQQASVSGIWAAGDCTDELYHQNNIAAGDAVKALEDIYNHLKAR